MQAYTLYRTPHSTNRDVSVTETIAGGNHPPALEVTTQTTLGGAEVAHGTAAGRVSTTEEEVYTTRDERDRVVVDTERVETTEIVCSEYIAVASDGIVGVARSDGGSEIAALVAHDWATSPPVSCQLDLTAFTAEVRSDAGATVEMVTSEVYPNDTASESSTSVGTRISYGAAAALSDISSETDELRGLSFSFDSEIGHVRGVAYSSGYLALYNVQDPSQYAQFVREHVDSLLSVADTEQERDTELSTLNSEVSEP